MEIKEIQERIKSLPHDQLADFVDNAIDEAYDEGYDARGDEIEEPDTEDNSTNIEYCLIQLKDAKERGLSIDDLIADLTIRSCIYMHPHGLDLKSIADAQKQQKSTQSLFKL